MGGYIGSSVGNVANAAERKQTYSITTATTSLTGLAYTPTKVHVFHNGVRLVDSTDYTATNGTSITLTNAAQNGDEVVVISYPSFQTSDTVSAANGGTFAGNVAMSGTLNVTDDLTVDTDTLFVDASANKVGIGLTSNISSALHVNSEVSLGPDNNNRMIIGSTSGGVGSIGTIEGGTASFSTATFKGGNLLVGATSVQGAGHTFSASQYNAVASGTGSFQIVQFRNPNGKIGTIALSGSATAYNTSSDYRLKENLETLSSAITRVKALKPKRFSWISDEEDSANVDGFLAHEAATVVPEAVTGTHDEVDKDGNPEYQGIDQSKLVPLLTAALQEAIAKIETLETKVAALEAE